MTGEHPIPFALPDIGDGEIAAVVDVLRSRWLTTGDQVRRFEEEFRATVGATHAVALNSCTAAMHLSLEALGIDRGDLVFLSPYTFAATAEVVRYLGARPVFVDVDPTTLNIDAARLRETVERYAGARSGRPRAIMPVHIAGVPCEMEPIWQLAREFDLAVVEDAAHAFPTRFGDHVVGRIPDGIAGSVCFSFYATKTITTGEGGMMVTEDLALADRARSMSLHGLSKQAWTRYSSGGSWAYDIVAPGFKYNLTDIAAAIGRAQLGRATAMRTRRAEIAQRYTNAFSTLASLECPTVPPGVTSAWHLYLLRLDPQAASIARDEFIDELTRAGIGTSVHFIPLHLHSYYANTYGYAPGDFPVATREYKRVVSLPIYSSMSDADVERVIRTVMALVVERVERVR
jgi:perosamine synthetase